MKSKLIILICSLTTIINCQAKEVISAESLLKEMIDKNHITYHPNDLYTVKQFSSYDRASDKGDPEHYSWFANSDCSFFIRKDTIDQRREYVMYDAKGPGAITRIWITGGGFDIENGIIRVYVDGDDTPVLMGKGYEFIGNNKEVGYPLSSALAPQSPDLNKGRNLYLPIPYAKECKMTFESDYIEPVDPSKGQMFYYNINYRTYKEGTKVESFKRNSLTGLKALLETTNKALLSPDKCAIQTPIQTMKSQATLQPKQNSILKLNKKNIAISHISVEIDAKNIEQALRSTIIKLTFDSKPTVWVPLGDFFGTGYAWRESLTWGTKVDIKKNTLSCSWVMPFKKDYKLEIENIGDQNVDIQTIVTLSPYKWNKKSMHFGAAWHQYSSISTGENKERRGKGGAVDLNYIDLKGQGVLVGDVLSIFNCAPTGHWKAWWGEGDEKIYVDGETFPSHFGTGTEDYYGYAWCRVESFSHPFIAQPIGEGNLSSEYTINSRYRALDAIPFQKSLDLDMELWHWVKTIVDYAPTTFYYMIPGGEHNIKSNPERAQEKVALHRYDILTGTPDDNGLLEAEDLIVDKAQEREIRGFYHDNISGGVSLQWIKNEQKEDLRGTFNMKQAGNYEVVMVVVKDKEVADFTVRLNGKSSKLIEPQSAEFGVERVSLGIYNLKAEGNSFNISAKELKKGDIIIDCIEFKPQF